MSDSDSTTGPSFEETIMAHLVRLYDEEQDEQRAEDRFDEDMKAAIEKATDEAVPRILEKARELGQATIAHEETYRVGFEQRLDDVWGDAFAKLHLVAAGCLEVGQELHRRDRSAFSEPEELRYSTLVFLHAKGCRVVGEIRCLLRAGFGMGALSRWRTLHELNVFSHVIADSEPDIARRYQDHELIQNLDDAKHYTAYYDKLGYEALDSDLLPALEKRAAELLAEHGQRFERDYGWASPVVHGREKKGFHGLEDFAGLAHMHPFYKWACNDVHGGSKGTLANVIPGADGKRVMLAGPTNDGLADPGHATALSLVQLTLPLITNAANMDYMDVAMMRVLLELATETGDAFFKAHEFVEAKKREAGVQG